MLTRLFHPDPAAKPREDVRIDLPGVNIAFNHRLKIAFLYELDTSMPENRYDELEHHLAAQGYFLQVIVAPAGMPIPLDAPRDKG